MEYNYEINLLFTILIIKEETEQQLIFLITRLADICALIMISINVYLYIYV